MLGLKLIHVSKMGPWNIPAPAPEGVIFKALFVLSMCILVCFREHWYSYATGCSVCLTHWGRVTHICVSKLNIIGSDNGLSPGRRQAIIWTNAGIILIGPLRTNFSEILIEIHTYSFKKMHFKMSFGKWRPFCLGLNELTRPSMPVVVKVTVSLYWMG